MNPRRALALAPLAIFPVALTFVVARSLLAGDLRELLASPLSALAMVAVGYPIALAVSWTLLRAIPRLARAGLGLTLGVGIASAEVSFWLVVHPFWQREFSNLFCLALVAACGGAVAMAFFALSRRPARPQS